MIFEQNMNTKKQGSRWMTGFFLECFFSLCYDGGGKGGNYDMEKKGAIHGNQL